MTMLLYHDHPYERKFEASVVSVNGNNVILDKTLFYPEGGGQPTDTGTIRHKGNAYQVVKVSKADDGIVHSVDAPGLQPGQIVEGEIDWERRYRHMRMHTAQHLLAAIFIDTFDGELAGNDIKWPRTKMDFMFKFSKEDLETLTRKFNEYVDKGIDVRSYTIPRENIPHEGIDPKRMRLFSRIPAAIQEIRIAEIVGVDKNPCGGIQVKNTKEIGHIRIEEYDNNRGKGKSRIVYSLIDK